MAAGRIDPMEQFLVEPVLGRHIEIGGFDLSFTNSALFMIVVFALLALFVSGGLKRQLVPGRWQVAVEGAVGFIDNMVTTSIGAEGKKFAPYLFSLFFFIARLDVGGYSCATKSLQCVGKCQVVLACGSSVGESQ